jgi:hypothetical protein
MQLNAPLTTTRSGRWPLAERLKIWTVDLTSRGRLQLLNYTSPPKNQLISFPRVRSASSAARASWLRCDAGACQAILSDALSSGLTRGPAALMNLSIAALKPWFVIR